MYKFISTKSFILIGCSVILSACASLEGTVVPLTEGQYKAVSLADNKKEAFEIAAHDAELTCKKEGGAYEVISQEQTKDSNEVETGNAVSDAMVGVALKKFGFSSSREFEVITKFRCKKG